MSRIEDLQKRLEADPNSRIFVQLAEEYRKAGLLDKAIEVCRSGLQKHPHYPSARVALGRALLEAGQHDKASAEFESVLQAVPDNILANKFLGETYHSLGRLSEALQKYEVAHSLAPEDTELEERMGRLRGEMELLPPLPTPLAATGSTEDTFVEASEPTLFVAPEAEEGSEADSATPDDSLSPIPLAEVEGPMELEDRYYQPPPKPSPPEEAPPPSPPPLAAPPGPEPPVPRPTPIARDLRPPTSPPALPPQRTVAPAAPKSPVVGPSSPETIAKSKADMETRTLAELYASQGHVEKAIEVYKNLLARNPGDVEYQTRVDELTMLQQASARRAKSTASVGGATSGESGAGGDAADEVRGKTIALLEQWLHAIRESKRA
ncbi:MAG TPA: tetratricopeptide repeat protein [Vicinamibacteria bacterium]|nr:tetratricopeptide repeat protein [Vicinamibacteria bacterium]